MILFLNQMIIFNFKWIYSIFVNEFIQNSINDHIADINDLIHSQMNIFTFCQWLYSKLDQWSYCSENEFIHFLSMNLFKTLSMILLQRWMILFISKWIYSLFVNDYIQNFTNDLIAGVNDHNHFRMNIFSFRRWFYSKFRQWLYSWVKWPCSFTGVTKLTLIWMCSFVRIADDPVHDQETVPSDNVLSLSREKTLSASPRIGSLYSAFDEDHTLTYK